LIEKNLATAPGAAPACISR